MNVRPAPTLSAATARGRRGSQLDNCAAKQASTEKSRVVGTPNRAPYTCGSDVRLSPDLRAGGIHFSSRSLSGFPSYLKRSRPPTIASPRARPHPMSRFVAVDRDTAYLLPPSVDEWLPQNHLARFVVEVIDQLDLSELVRQYAGRGSAAYHPAMLLGLLVYGYATGVHSSRKIERACHDSVAFRFIVANAQPDRQHRHVPPPLPAADRSAVRAGAR